MASVKEKMRPLIAAQPDDMSYDEILGELAFDRMVERDLEVRAVAKPCRTN